MEKELHQIYKWGALGAAAMLLIIGLILLIVIRKNYK